MDRIVPGKPAASLVIERLRAKDPDEVMPPPETHKQLKPAEVALLEQWIADLRALAHQALEAGVEVTGWKLVEKRATRKWVDEEKTAASLSEQFTHDEIYDQKLKSPAQMEKLLKKSGMEIPEGLVVAVSSGTTIAPEDDPRPKANVLGQQLGKALGRLSC